MARTLCLAILLSVSVSCGGGLRPHVESAQPKVADAFEYHYGEPKPGCEFRHLGDGLYVAENCRTERCDDAVMIRGENCTHEQFTLYQCVVTEGPPYGVDCYHTRCPLVTNATTEREREVAFKASLGGGYWGCERLIDEQPMRWETRGSLTYPGFSWLGTLWPSRL